MLTKHQCRLLYFIRDYTVGSGGIAPSFETMREGMGLRSKSGIHRFLTALEERGFIRRFPRRARAIEVIRMPGDEADALEDLRQAAFRLENEAGVAIAVGVMADLANEMLIRHESNILPTTNAVGNA